MIKNYIISIILLVIFTNCFAGLCPNGLNCPGNCCVENDSYFCCPEQQETNGKQIYVVNPGGLFQWHWGALVVGLIISIIVSVILSLLCCFFCNGCWWHRKRNPESYTAAGLPLGTVTFSSYPPFYHDDPPSNTSRKVRFDQNGYPKPALKKNNYNDSL